MTNKLRDIVARRHGLTDDERLELRGRTVAQLSAHAEHLVGRRTVVDAAKRRNPGLPDYAVANIEGAYDGGGVPVDVRAGKRLANQALADRVNGGDPETRDLLGRIAQRTIAVDDAENRKHRITERLRAAGLNDRED